MSKILGMATIATIDDFKIGMFYRLGNHRGPYFKAYKGDGKTKSASILIDSLEIVFIRGLSNSDLDGVLEWAKEHQEELKENWNNLLAKKPLNKITSSAPPALNYVKALPDLILEAAFENGIIKHIDFKKIDLLGVLKPLKDQSFFEQVQLVDAFPTWPGEIDLDPDDLWEVGEIIPSAASIN